jgi:septal ring factor EnvC (AmiA/AmiB activator)
MSTSLARKLLYLGLIAVLCLSPLAFADSKADKEKQLDALLQQIEKLKQTIDVKENSKSQYIRQLKEIERGIGKLSRRISDIGKQISNKKSELHALRSTRLKHQKQLSRENDYLAEQVYTAFTLGKQEKVKLLFSQQDPQVLQRNLVYYQYFSNARVELIENVQRNIDKIVETEALIREARQALESSQQQLNTQKAQLDKDRLKRQSIIGSLDQQLKQQGGELSKLEDEATQLQQLIDSIQKIFDDAPEDEITRQAFADLRGKLAWPVEGKLRKLFGKTKPLSSLRWQGVLIEAPGGRYVRAVSHGRVAFADWLRGFGNLVIIDHGNTYLSLYGHNESLFKEAGEWVEAGDVIGSTGNSGGHNKTGLYFEIRRNGKPQNPTQWCKAGEYFNSG